MARPLTYWDYIRVEDLCALQGGAPADATGGPAGEALSNSEHLFVVVHQVFELWFKLVLRELDMIRDSLGRNPVPEQDIAAAVYSLDRIAEILRLSSDHFRVMETLTTRDYLGFRDKLFPASGFQSAQLREIEISLGLEAEQRLPFGSDRNSWLRALEGPAGEETPAMKRIKARLTQGPSLRELLDDWLARTPIHGSTPDKAGDAEVVEGFLSSYLEGHETAISRQLEIVRERSPGLSESEMTERYESQLTSARRWLGGTDVDEDQRPRRRRIRAAALFVMSYRELPLLAWPRRLIDTIVEVEQLFLIFRQRHARMVERVIGRRVGTGGSAGVDYLDRTALEYRIFKDLWAVRTLLLGVADQPPVQNAELYGFQSGGRA